MRRRAAIGLLASVMLLLALATIAFLRAAPERVPQGTQETEPTTQMSRSPDVEQVASQPSREWRYRNPPQKSKGMFERILDEAPLPEGSSPEYLDRYELAAACAPLRQWLLDIVRNDLEPIWWREEAIDLLVQMPDERQALAAANSFLDWLETTDPADGEDREFRRRQRWALPIVVLSYDPSEDVCRFIKRAEGDNWEKFLHNFANYPEPSTPEYDTAEEKEGRARRRRHASVLLERYAPVLRGEEDAGTRAGPEAGS